VAYLKDTVSQLTGKSMNPDLAWARFLQHGRLVVRGARPGGGAGTQSRPALHRHFARLSGHR